MEDLANTGNVPSLKGEENDLDLGDAAHGFTFEFSC